MGLSCVYCITNSYTFTVTESVSFDKTEGKLQCVLRGYITEVRNDVVDNVARPTPRRQNRRVVWCN